MPPTRQRGVFIKSILLVLFTCSLLSCDQISDNDPSFNLPLNIFEQPTPYLWTTPEESIDCIPLTPHCLGPIPSNLLALPDPASPTGIRINLTEKHFSEGVFAYAAQYLNPSLFNKADGFSPVGQIVIPLYAPVSPDDLPGDPASSIDPDSPILLVDTRAGNPVPFHIRLDPKGLAYDPPQYFLVMIPARPLQLATPHVVVLRKALKQPDGSEVTASPAFEQIKSGNTAGPLLTRLGALYEPLFDYIEHTLNIGRNDLLFSFAFTTRSAESLYAPMLHMRQIVEGNTRDHPPVATINSISTKGREPSLACEIHGSFPSPSFRSAEDGALQFDQDGLPIFQDDEDTVPFLLKLPQVPAGTRIPVVIFGHGLWVFKETVFQVSEDLLKAGFAVIAIDAACHGSRILTDGYIHFLFRLETLQAAVSCLTQTVIDELALVSLLKGDLGRLDMLPFSKANDSGDGEPDLDGSQIYYVGQSMGTVLGLSFIALSKDIRAAVLNVPGSGIVNIITHGELTSLLVGNRFIPAGTSPLDAQILYHAGQMFVDYLDPLNMTPHVSKDPFEDSSHTTSVLLQVSMNDGLIPNWCTDVMARGLDIPLVEPSSYHPYGLSTIPSPAAGSGLFQYDFIYDWPQIPLLSPLISHGLLMVEPQSRHQLVHYLSTAYETGIPEIVDPYAER